MLYFSDISEQIIIVVTYTVVYFLCFNGNCFNVGLVILHEYEKQEEGR